MEWTAIDPKIPFSSYDFLWVLGANNPELIKVFDWQFVEYFNMIEIRYLPAFSGKWYLLQTKRQSL